MAKKDKNQARQRRKKSIRQRVSGSAERPRLSVYRSNKHIYAQVIDDVSSCSLLSISDLAKTLESELSKPAEDEAENNKIRRARIVGGAVAKACLDKGITKVVFDRNGYLYWGRVRALAEAARKGGLEF